MTDKQMIAAGTPNYLAVKHHYSDEQIREHVESLYGWKDVTIQREDHLVLVQPIANGKETSNGNR